LLHSPCRRGTAFFSALAKPTQSNLDAVIGVSNGPADAFADLAAILRFNPAGQVDARNGSAYAAVTPFAYRAGALYTVNPYLDLRQHRYDATRDNYGQGTRELLLQKLAS
jgi:hypothetical protein